MMPYERGYRITEGISFIRFIPSTPNFTALVTLPYTLFEKYKPDGSRMYERGEVVRVDKEKYLLQNDGKIDPANPPPTNPLCKLFRDDRRYNWVREEFCLRGFERYYDGGDPGRTGWYRVIAAVADSATPPPSLVGTVWEKVKE